MRVGTISVGTSMSVEMSVLQNRTKKERERERKISILKPFFDVLPNNGVVAEMKTKPKKIKKE